MSKKRSSIGSKKLPYGLLRANIIRYFKRFPKKRLTAGQLTKKLKVKNTTQEVEEHLKKLLAQQVLFRTVDEKFGLERRDGSQRGGNSIYVEGIVDAKRSGSAYILVEGQEQDVFVPGKKLRGALNGDLVRVRIRSNKHSRKVNGEVVEILRHARTEFVGTVYTHKKKWIVVPDNPMVTHDILIKDDPKMEIDTYDKVVVKITDWNTGKLLTGKIMSKLDPTATDDLEMSSILTDKGFSVGFEEDILAYCEQIPTVIEDEEIGKRRDIRHILTFTIDPDTAKDFDDALSYEVLENDLFSVGIHIADVTHYLKPGTPLDQEAYRRSTSVYLVDRVAPMLPEILSNDLCSLNPHEDKLTFSAIFTFDKQNKMVDQWFGKTIIHSDHRFTYEEAQEVIETKKGPHADVLSKLNALAQHLRKQNMKEGAIQFDTDEVKFQLDEKGNPIELKVKERKDAHLLIEDFMLLANRSVATYIARKGKDMEIPFVYRVHDLPNTDRIHEFALFAKELGFQMRTQTPKEIAKSFNELQKAAAENPALRILAPLAIRSMAKAIYTTYNIGHYGLGFTHYTHFTSPIRRYADVLVHRILEANLSEVKRVKKMKLEDQCKYISNQERKAVEAERESVEFKQVEYIQNHVGESFEGVVSGIIERGIFVQLVASRAEGLIRFDTLGESFSLADHRFRAVGLHSGRVFHFGDPVTVKVIRADIERREIDMVLVEE